jgi:hypothetical protein
MGKTGKAEVERRIDEVYDLIINRVTYRKVCAYAEQKWGLSERQTCRYLARARERILELAAPDQKEQLAKALASYESLFAKQVAAGHLNDARQTMDSLVRLLGLAAPEQHAYEGVVNVIEVPPGTSLP